MTTLSLNANSFQINGSAVEFPIDIESLAPILGNLYRVIRKEKNTIYTWDNLGILGYSKDGKNIDSLNLSFIKGKFDFSTKEIFNGTFLIENQDIVNYYWQNKDKRIPLFERDKSGALVLNNISVWFGLSFKNKKDIRGLSIRIYKPLVVDKIPKDKYLIKNLDEEKIDFVDFGFKLSIIQELMYKKELITPKFDLYEFVKWYDKRKIDIEEEGYEPIDEVTQYFKDLPVPTRLASEITEIYQDGGNDIYLQLLRFGEGWEEFWDIEMTEDAKHFPNLKKAVLCYAKDNVVLELNKMGIKASYL